MAGYPLGYSRCLTHELGRERHWLQSDLRPRKCLPSRTSPKCLDSSQQHSSKSSSIAFTGGVVSFISGFDVGIITGALMLVVPFYGIENLPHWKGLLCTVTTIGAIAGSVLAGSLADNFGRRNTLMIACLISLIGGSVASTLISLQILLVGRLISGVAVGLYSAVVPIYIAECAEAENRGFLATVPQLMVHLRSPPLPAPPSYIEFRPVAPIDACTAHRESILAHRLTIAPAWETTLPSCGSGRSPKRACIALTRKRTLSSHGSETSRTRSPT
jgi:hypothetical protein